jgi:methylated-DNA-[protein]-cysteine S-methyltransferase
MCEIPYGETVSYGWIAGRIAKERGGGKMSAQAVGGAVGHNPVCNIVPCHRVIGADGSLTGYGGGIHRKKALLELEGVDLTRTGKQK